MIAVFLSSYCSVFQVIYLAPSLNFTMQDICALGYTTDSFGNIKANLLKYYNFQSVLKNMVPETYLSGYTA